MAKDNKTPQEELCPGEEGFLSDAVQLPPAEFRRLVAHRARQITHERLELPETEEARREVEEMVLEKINKEPDFLPAKFLQDGANRSRAVCRVLLGGGSGTGFLIAPGLIMTNNHVLDSKRTAAGATAEFGFAEGEELTRVTINPDRFFITSPSHELDYTIVAINDSELGEIQPIGLRRTPASVTRHERVHVIQHPRGRQKEVALHDNRVEFVLDKAIRYRTDTEPGSSGSPVFDNGWNLVALHHAGVSRDDGSALNEGIRISSIVNDLQRRTRNREDDADRLFEVLETVTDTSPYLGFFESAGLGDADGLEVEVPGFTGNSDYCDVGCMNIEHFNSQVTETRLKRVADVIQQLSLDVIGLTEVEAGALDRLTAELSQRGFETDYVLEDARGRQDLALLYDRDTTTVEMLELTNAQKRRLAGRTSSGRTLFPRKPLFARCFVEEEDGRSVEFLMVLVHLKAFGDAVSRERRRGAARVLRELLEELREEHELPAILLGDYNETLGNDVLSPLTDAPDLITLTNDDHAAGHLSYIGRRHRSLIDHFIVSNDAVLGQIAGDDAAIVRLDRSVRDFADTISDHVPLVVRMVLRPAEVVADSQPTPLEVRVPIPHGTTEMVFTGVPAQESTKRRRTPKK